LYLGNFQIVFELIGYVDSGFLSMVAKLSGAEVYLNLDVADVDSVVRTRSGAAKFGRA